MHPLPDAARRLCSYLALASLVLGIATLPLCVRSAADRTYRPARVANGDAPLAAPTAVPIHRNPFQSDPIAPPATPRPAPSAVVSRTAGAAAFAPALPVVSALAIGAHPSAVLEENGTSRIRTIGDRVGTHVIVAISLDGVRLDDGTLLGMTSGSESPLTAPRPDTFPAIPIGAQPLPDVRGDTR
jgi:hypothetical protein